jgi:hypothetical protein
VRWSCIRTIVDRPFRRWFTVLPRVDKHHSKGITMRVSIMQTQAAPFVKLMQANMELLTQFSTSPEVMSQATANANQLFQQASGSTMNLMQSGAFAQVMQGMMKNYTEFLTELGQGTVAMMSQANAALLQHSQEATNGLTEATDIRGRRGRQAA